MKIKKDYKSLEAEVIEVKLEIGFAQSGGSVSSGDDDGDDDAIVVTKPTIEL